jgi:hypothetical protein
MDLTHVGLALAETGEIRWRRGDLAGAEEALTRPCGWDGAQCQWRIGRPGTGERKVGSRDMANDPT